MPNTSTGVKLLTQETKFYLKNGGIELLAALILKNSNGGLPDKSQVESFIRHKHCVIKEESKRDRLDKSKFLNSQLSNVLKKIEEQWNKAHPAPERVQEGASTTSTVVSHTDTSSQPADSSTSAEEAPVIVSVSIQQGTQQTAHTETHQAPHAAQKVMKRDDEITTNESGMDSEITESQVSTDYDKNFIEAQQKNSSWLVRSFLGILFVGGIIGAVYYGAPATFLAAITYIATNFSVTQFNAYIIAAASAIMFSVIGTFFVSNMVYAHRESLFKNMTLQERAQSTLDKEEYKTLGRTAANGWGAYMGLWMSPSAYGSHRKTVNEAFLHATQEHEYKRLQNCS